MLNLKERFPNTYRVYKRLTILEVEKQEQRENAQRDYNTMKEYYDIAFDLYSKANEEDSEMEILKNQMQNVIGGGGL